MTSMKYDDIRDGIRSGDCFEFAGSTPLGHIIRWFSKQKVNHTEICLSINEYSNYAGNRKFFLGANSHGIELRPVSRALADFKGKMYYRKLRATDAQRNLIADWALQQCDVPYAYGNLFRNIWGRVDADARRLFCSEFRFIACVVGGVIPGLVFNKRDQRVYDVRTGKPVPAPRPGEFDRYNIDEPEIEVFI
jgi:hypothetical protein